MSSSHHPIGIHELQIAYATEQSRPQQILDLVANDRGFECLILSDCTGVTELGNHTAALRMVTMQGGVFGCVATSEAVVAATTVSVTTTGDHHAG